MNTPPGSCGPWAIHAWCSRHNWDRFNVTYDVAQDAAVQRLQTFLAEVKAASPDTKVVVPKYFAPVVIP